MILYHHPTPEGGRDYWEELWAAKQSAALLSGIAGKPYTVTRSSVPCTRAGLMAALETLGRGETLPGEVVWDSSDYLTQRYRRGRLRAAPEGVVRRAARLAGVSRRALLWNRVTDETWEKMRELVDGEEGEG